MPGHSQTDIRVCRGVFFLKIIPLLLPFENTCPQINIFKGLFFSEGKMKDFFMENKVSRICFSLDTP